MRKILVVDDDPHIRRILCFALQKAGLGVIEAEDGQQALQRFDAEQPDLVVLDILMPEMDGTDVCRQLRRRSSTPIVFLSSKDEELDRIVGLEMGGDDYVTKPFSPRELVARVRAVLRRTAASAEQATRTAIPRMLQHGRVRLELDAFKAYWGRQEVELTATEFGILRTLMNHPGKVFTRDNLMDGAYELRKIVSDRTIDSHVRRIRSKFNAAGGDPIQTAHGLGYKLGPC